MSGSHTFAVGFTTVGATAEIWVDNVKQGSVDFKTSAGASTALTIKMTGGLHTMMVVAPYPVTKSVNLSSITVKRTG